MTFDRNRVRIELCDRIAYHPDDNAMQRKQAAEVWLSNDDGRIVRTKTPAAVIMADSRAGVLRDLAAWIENHDDESLAGLVRDYMGLRSTR